MQGRKIQTKFLLTLIVLFTAMLIFINGGVAWWRYNQYQQEQLANQLVMRNTLNNIIQMHIQELRFLGEAVVRNKSFLSSTKCYVQFVSGKNIERCAKKTLDLSVEDQNTQRLPQLYTDRISADANNTYNYLTGKNPNVKIFDLIFQEKILWRQNGQDLFNTAITNLLANQARETKKTIFGIEKDIDNQLYLFGIFAHFNPKEYYFSRIGIDLKQLLRARTPCIKSGH